MGRGAASGADSSDVASELAGISFEELWSMVPSELGGPCEGGSSVSPESYCGDSTTCVRQQEHARLRCARTATQTPTLDDASYTAGAASVDITTDNADVYDRYAAGVSSVSVPDLLWYRHRMVQRQRKLRVLYRARRINILRKRNHGERRISDMQPTSSSTGTFDCGLGSWNAGTGACDCSVGSTWTRRCWQLCFVSQSPALRALTAPPVPRPPAMIRA